MLDDHWKPESTGRPFLPSMGLLSNVHPRFHTRNYLNLDITTVERRPTGLEVKHPRETDGPEFDSCVWYR